MRRSLILRMTLVFALIALIVVGATGLFLYHSVKADILMRADNGVLTRMIRYRNLLHTDLGLEDLRSRPQLFQNMLGDEQDVFLLQRPGHAPLIDINPRQASIPELDVIAEGRTPSRSDLRTGRTADGTPLRVAAARVSIDGEPVKLIIGHLLNKEMALLASYRRWILEAVLSAFLATALFGYMALQRGLRPLRRLARQAADIRPTTLTQRLGLEHTPAELDRLTQSVNGMLDRLEDGYERLTQFSADLAHEIRTPVNALMGHHQVALSHSRSVEEYQSLLVTNLAELERISRLVENILFLARADDAREVIEIRCLSLEEEVRRVVEYFENLAEERSLCFQVRVEGDIRADPMLLRRALSNLVANAVHHGSPASDIIIRIEKERRYCCLIVENRSLHRLQPAQVERLFDRFYRGDASRQSGGDSNGLGLAIVAAIMKLHGGHVRAEARHPDGLQVMLCFPSGQRDNGPVASST
ncbi:heavy metal sensor histidine kinase [Kushneria phosphatilytica]|uniref:Sensor protein n=1 Tax=Kushneria phosphatilytica TaxID=657387 RepID=A0A1S1NV92_9GAMM|nr:heavy metal sensor histidine kinase [Kushneria phosphatilytica]OHV10507.1 hypothetical protein BH688_08825 [Kushneria phosphatilytica]QEL11935.1 heavy metal sensor histidine kinase [Kushneria phosphatilytica]